MLDILNNILELLYTFFSSVGTLLADIVMLIGKVTKTVLYIPSLMTWLPDSVSAILVSTFGVVVVYKVLGREG